MKKYGKVCGLGSVTNESGEVRGREVDGGIASGYATDLFLGDPISYDAVTGTYVLSDGTSFEGTFDGIEYDGVRDREVEPSFRAGTVMTGRVKLKMTPAIPSNVYEIEADAATDASIVGKACNLNMTRGNHFAGTSAVTVDVASAGAGTAVKVLGFSKRVGNVAPFDEAGAVLVVQAL